MKWNFCSIYHRTAAVGESCKNTSNLLNYDISYNTVTSSKTFNSRTWQSLYSNFRCYGILISSRGFLCPSRLQITSISCITRELIVPQHYCSTPLSLQLCWDHWNQPNGYYHCEDNYLCVFMVTIEWHWNCESDISQQHHYDSKWCGSTSSSLVKIHCHSNENLSKVIAKFLN